MGIELKIVNNVSAKVFLNRIQKLNRDLQSGKFIDDIRDPVFKKATKSLNNIFTNCVKRFYKKYHPRFYKRTKSLYKAYKIEINDTSVQLKFGPPFMPDTHRASRAYIYQLSFIEGWHGGAKLYDREAKSPRSVLGSGIPHWRTPHPLFANGGKPYRKWGSKAARSTSPNQLIDTALEEYSNEFCELGDRQFNKVLGRYKIFDV